MVQFPNSIRELSCLPFSDAVNAVNLTPNVAEDAPIPQGARFVVFSSNGDFYVSGYGTAAVPGDVGDGTASELNPTMRDLKGVSVLSLISEIPCRVTMSFYGG